MAADDMREYRTFYGIHINKWEVNFGSFSNHNKILTEDYISDGCSTQDTSIATQTHKFIYSEHIKKIYFIEGTITGHVTFGASTATAHLCKYRVSVCKMHQNTIETELYTTDWVTIDDELTWDSTYNIGEEKVYPFRIDAWEFAELNEFERIYIKIESTCTDNTSYCTCAASECTNIVLWHSNDATWCDLQIELPFRL